MEQIKEDLGIRSIYVGCLDDASFVDRNGMFIFQDSFHSYQLIKILITLKEILKNCGFNSEVQQINNP